MRIRSGLALIAACFAASPAFAPRPSAKVLLQLTGRYTHRPVMRWKGADDAVHPVRRREDAA